MKSFRIEATVPTHVGDLKSVLEAARDEWLATTPQHTHESDPSHPVSAAKTDVERDTLSSKEGAHPTSLFRSNERLRKAIADSNAAGLDHCHTRAKALIDAGIASAVTQASAFGDVPNYTGTSPVRASIVGHVKVRATDGVYERLSVHVDHAPYG